MENKLTEKELLNWLDAYKNNTRHLVSPNQYRAANQLEEIVKEHFSDSTGYNDLLSKSVITINSQKALLKEQSKEITRLLIEQRGMEQQKPTVTREEIFHFHQNLMTISDDSESAQECHDREIDYIYYWLKEIGLEVTDGE